MGRTFLRYLKPLAFRLAFISLRPFAMLAKGGFAYFLCIILALSLPLIAKDLWSFSPHLPNFHQEEITKFILQAGKLLGLSLLLIILFFSLSLSPIRSLFVRRYLSLRELPRDLFKTSISILFGLQKMFGKILVLLALVASSSYGISLLYGMAKNREQQIAFLVLAVIITLYILSKFLQLLLILMIIGLTRSNFGNSLRIAILLKKRTRIIIFLWLFLPLVISSKAIKYLHNETLVSLILFIGFWYCFNQAALYLLDKLTELEERLNPSYTPIEDTKESIAITNIKIS